MVEGAGDDQPLLFGSGNVDGPDVTELRMPSGALTQPLGAERARGRPESSENAFCSL